MDQENKFTDSTIDSGHGTRTLPDSRLTDDQSAMEEDVAATSTPRAVPSANHQLTEQVLDVISRPSVSGSEHESVGAAFLSSPGSTTRATAGSIFTVSGSSDVSAMLAAAGLFPSVFRCPHCKLELKLGEIKENFNASMFHASKSPNCPFIQKSTNLNRNIYAGDDQPFHDNPTNTVAEEAIFKGLDWRLALEVSRTVARDADVVVGDVPETPPASLEDRIRTLEDGFRSLKEGKVDKNHYERKYSSMNDQIDEASYQRSVMRGDIKGMKDAQSHLRDCQKTNRLLIRDVEKSVTDQHEKCDRRHNRQEERLGALGEVAMHHGRQLTGVKSDLDAVSQQLASVAVSVNNVADSEPRMEPAGAPVNPPNVMAEDEDGIEVEGVDAEQEWQQQT